MTLKSYQKHQEDMLVMPPVYEATGVACPENEAKANCQGEMLWIMPRQEHPEIPGIYRAVCGQCNWRGWV